MRRGRNGRREEGREGGKRRASDILSERASERARAPVSQRASEPATSQRAIEGERELTCTGPRVRACARACLCFRTLCLRTLCSPTLCSRACACQRMAQKWSWHSWSRAQLVQCALDEGVRTQLGEVRFGRCRAEMRGRIGKRGCACFPRDVRAGRIRPAAILAVRRGLELRCTEGTMWSRYWQAR